MSLRWKLTLALGLLAATVTLALGWASYRATSQRLMQEVDSSLVQFERALFGRPDRGRGGSFVPDRPLGVEQFMVQVLSVDGAVVQATAGVALPVSDRDVEIASEVVSGVNGSSFLRSDHGSVDGERVHVRINTVGVKTGAVQLARDLRETDAVLADLRVRTAWLMVLVAGVGALIGWLVSRGITRSLARLTATATAVAATGRLDVPVPVTGRDEVGRLGAAFNTMLGALRGSREQQARLVQDAGHELRTPLTSLRTNIDVLRRHDQMPADMKAQLLDDLDREAGELQVLVNEIVELASDQRAEEQVGPVDLAAVVDASVERIARRSGRTVNVERDVAGPCIVTGRAASLARAVDNLLDNAAKFDPSGAAIDVRVSTGGVTVRDRGPGIADTDLPHVFERFHRSDSARALPGSGLGLAIVAEVAAAHGGRAFAANHPDGGAVVGFDLPFTPPVVAVERSAT